jgi:hypothetical protein
LYTIIDVGRCIRLILLLLSTSSRVVSLRIAIALRYVVVCIDDEPSFVSLITLPDSSWVLAHRLWLGTILLLTLLLLLHLHNFLLLFLDHYLLIAKVLLLLLSQLLLLLWALCLRLLLLLGLRGLSLLLVVEVALGAILHLGHLQLLLLLNLLLHHQLVGLLLLNLHATTFTRDVVIKPYVLSRLYLVNTVVHFLVLDDVRCHVHIIQSLYLVRFDRDAELLPILLLLLSLGRARIVILVCALD